MQSYIAMGKIYREPKTSEAPSGLAMTKFSIEVPRSGETKNGTKIHDYFSCLSWGKVAEKVSNNFTKGDDVIVKGEFHSNSYTSQEGTKVYVVELVVSDIEKLNMAAEPVVQDATPIKDDDLPF